MLGEYCATCQGTCNCSHDDCGCDDTPSPCLPGCENGECEEWLPAECVFWMGDSIDGTPIKKGVRLTEIITYLLARIADHEARITVLEP